MPSLLGKGIALSGSIVIPNPSLVSNPVSVVYTSFDCCNVTSTCSFPAELKPSVAQETKSSIKVAGVQETKSRRSKKIQRQALLTALEELENDESKDETSTYAPSPSPHIVVPTPTTSNLNLAPSNLSLHEIRDPASPSSSSLNSSTSLDASSGKENFSNNILLWNSYDDFASFCSKIEIVFNDISEAKLFLDNVRAQHQMPKINLEHSNTCVEHLHALRF